VLRLNLASGTDIREFWTNLDAVRQWPGSKPCDIVWDARKDAIPFMQDSVDEIYAGYLLLHLLRRYHFPVLADIRRVLKPGGMFRVGEVDMQAVMLRYLLSPTDPNLNELIWGEQGRVHGEDLAEFDTHNQGFTVDSLITLLAEAGFKDFKRVKVHGDAVWYELTLECTK
jgi:predicted SAM-dependent methyltransferase